MAEALKNVYNDQFFELLFKQLKKEVPELTFENFISQIYTDNWAELELKQRMKHIAFVFNSILEKDFKKSIKQILNIVDRHQREHSNGFNFEFLFIPEFVTEYGLNHFDTSISAIEKITQFTSCEFTVRHFLIEYPEKMMAQMKDWAKHPHSYVRRLSSEGMRTRLPWAIAVPHLKQNPKPIFEILHILVKDTDPWVQKSVSNSLNDLSKDFPNETIDFTKKYYGGNKEVNKLLKHASRTFLKSGNKEVLQIFNIQTTNQFNLKIFDLDSKKVKIGDKLKFRIAILNENLTNSSLIRIEYRLYFLRQNGTYHAKTFKISEKSVEQGELIEITKEHNFKIISTRTFYSGKHYISLIINGNESEKIAFELV